jgi:DNA-binding response OmpR family regulator
MTVAESASRPHVLVVDDDPMVAEALAFALAKEYRIHAAATGQAVCALLETHPIAPIVLDVCLGEQDGLDLVGMFRTISSAPILIVTGHSSEDLAIRALRAKVAGYREKPLNVDGFHGSLTRLVSTTSPALGPVASARRYMDEERRLLRTGQCSQVVPIST